jgi:hypothetical protein
MAMLQDAMHHVYSAHTIPGAVAILPYGKFSTDNIVELATILYLADTATTFLLPVH